jgi:hypothetical protein
MVNSLLKTINHVEVCFLHKAEDKAMARLSTYDEFSLHTIMPAPGWQAIYFADGAHFLGPVHALALVSRITYEVKTRRIVNSDPSKRPEAALREIVGMEYSLDCGWAVLDEVRNYCGLLPPGSTIQDHEAMGACAHKSLAQPQEKIACTSEDM